MSNATDLVDRTLTELSDSGVRVYTRANVLRSINDQILSLADLLGQNPECGWFKHDEDITVDAGEEEVDLIDALTYTPAEIRSLFHVLPDGHEVPMSPMKAGSYGAYRRTTLVDPTLTPHYGERRPPVSATARIWNLVVLPVANGDRPIHVYYRYDPDVLVEGTTPTLCPFDRKWDELISKGAARREFGKKGLNEGVFDADLRDLLASFLQAESRTIGGDVPQGTKEVVADYLWD